MFDLFANPEFIRLARTKLRPRTMTFIAIASAGVFGAVLILFNVANRNNMTPSHWHMYFFVILGMQAGVGSIYAMNLASQSIALERERFTFDFQRMVAMGPVRLAIGKLLGSSCEAFFGASIGSFFALIPVMLGHIPPLMFVEAEVVAFTTMVLVTSFGMMASSVVAKTAHAGGLTILVFILVPFLFGNAASPGIWNAGNPIAMFRRMYETLYSMPGLPNTWSGGYFLFGFEVPPLLAFLLVDLSLVLLLFAITVRRITDEELSFLRPRVAAIFFFTVQIMLVGGMASYLRLGGGNAAMALPTYHIVNLVLLSMLAFGLMPSGELLRGRISRGERNQHWKIFFERTNRLQDAPPMTIMLLFCAAYVVIGLLLTTQISFRPFTHTTPMAALLLVPCVAIATAALTLYVALYTEKGGLKLTAVVVGAAYAVPGILLGILATEKLFAVSPVAWLAYFTADDTSTLLSSSMRDNIPPYWLCPLLFVILAILFSTLAAFRIRFLLDMYEIHREQERDRKPEELTNARWKAVAAARAMLNKASPEDKKPDAPPVA